MANEFVRSIKGVRNVDNLSKNITTENDLISTKDNEVYVVTNGGYKKITGGETDVSNLIKSIDTLNENVKKLNEYNDVKVYKDIDLMDKNSLNSLPLGLNYVTSAKNKTEDMRTNNGWLTVHYANNVKRFLFQPFSEGRTYYNYILGNNNLGAWK